MNPYRPNTPLEDAIALFVILALTAALFLSCQRAFGGIWPYLSEDREDRHFHATWRRNSEWIGDRHQELHDNAGHLDPLERWAIETMVKAALVYFGGKGAWIAEQRRKRNGFAVKAPPTETPADE